jgi:hypothetical protein
LGWAMAAGAPRASAAPASALAMKWGTVFFLVI